MNNLRHLIGLALMLFVSSAGQTIQAQINANKVVEPYIMPRNFLFVEVGGPARNAVLFNYQRIFPVNDAAALTARAGFFGFGNSRSGGSEAQLDVAGGLGLLLSIQNEHNMEIEAAYDRFLSREEYIRNRDQNRYLLTAGYRLQPDKHGKGFGMRVGLGMLVYTETEKMLNDFAPSVPEESTGFYPMGYLGIGYAF